MSKLFIFLKTPGKKKRIRSVNKKQGQNLIIFVFLRLFYVHTNYMTNHPMQKYGFSLGKFPITFPLFPWLSPRQQQFPQFHISPFPNTTPQDSIPQFVSIHHPSSAKFLQELLLLSMASGFSSQTPSVEVHP